MVIRWRVTIALLALYWASGSCLLPVFTQDMNNLALSESTPVGRVVYTLAGLAQDTPIKYFGLVGTDKFSVDPSTGQVTLVEPLDREKEDAIKFLVFIEDEEKQRQMASVTVIVIDENDNPPIFRNSPYEVDVAEDVEVGTTILQGVLVEDEDLVGDGLEVDCVPNEQWLDACGIFEVATLHSNASSYLGALVLRRPLDYSQTQFYRFRLRASDGSLDSTSDVEVRVVDVQNSPPVFSGGLSATVKEDAPIGSLVLTLKARDADRALPRPLTLELITNPMDYFVLDSTTGELRTAKPLDREALPDPSSPLNITVRATELVDGVPVVSESTSTSATATVTIRDVNDEPPRFDKKEYSVVIPESLPAGTPLPGLDMIVFDTDVGLNSAFSLRLVDELGAFEVEPEFVTGRASVTIRLNSTLDYEDPNQRKLILEVVAQESNTSSRLSSRASVTVTVTDVNDNAPQFEEPAYTARVMEDGASGTPVVTVTATDRDTGRFGTAGIVYELSGAGADLFSVDRRTGSVAVAECATPAKQPCLDFETRTDYYLHFKAIDEDGSGQSSVVPLQVTVVDANDNPPVFDAAVYRAIIDEDALKFEPELQVQARDADATSELRYSIIEPTTHTFVIDPLSGRVNLAPGKTVTSPDSSNKIHFTVMVTDGVHNATCRVEVTVRDVNNHAPVFARPAYEAMLPEDIDIGTEIAAVTATDLDSGDNARIKYSIRSGAADAFGIDEASGIVTVTTRLDYDRKNTYNIVVVAADNGVPSLSGTAELTVQVTDVNDKKPRFVPLVQRAEISADAAPGSFVHNLTAEDPDADDPSMLVFHRSWDRLIRAVDSAGREVSEEGIFESWFEVLSNGTVVVSQSVDRSRAAVVTLPVTVTDASAPKLQYSSGELSITLVEVNRHAPVFSQPSYVVEIAEEPMLGTELGTFIATDTDTSVAAIVIEPPSPYFVIDNATGVVRTSSRIDYERTHSINFTLVAFDSGSPQRSASAPVMAIVLNVNDESPSFAAAQYDAAVKEDAPAHTSVITVSAVDKDEGDFGAITYSLSGDNASLFTVDPHTGVVTVSSGVQLDREEISELRLRAIASDGAPELYRRSANVPLHIRVLDVNDNAPVFTQSVYKSSVAENVPLAPPAALLQLLAEDRDEGVNADVRYSIVNQTEPGAFKVDPKSGILYAARAVRGGTVQSVAVRASDGAHDAYARADITVLAVNQHAPVFTHPPAEVRDLLVPENAAEADFLVTKVQATDDDSGDNGRISYYLKVDNRNVVETGEFTIDPETGDLRTKSFLDRELRPEYSLVIAAVDHGSPAHFETLRLLNVVLVDEEDNDPLFPTSSYHFYVEENMPAGVLVGAVKATDKDAGDNGKVYYHVIDGNKDGAFVVHRTDGAVRTNATFDREQKSEYKMTILASNKPVLERADLTQSHNYSSTEGSSAVFVTVKVLDANDNEPKFTKDTYYAGVRHTAHVNEAIIQVMAKDPDLAENGSLTYAIAASHLYKFGAKQSSGSVVPSPFNVTQYGVVTTAQHMAEYRGDRFVLEVVAREAAAPRRQAVANIIVWVVERSSYIRMVISRACATLELEPLAAELGVASGCRLVPGRRRRLVHADTLYDDWCEVQLHAVDPSSHQVLQVEKVLQGLDSQYDRLRGLYHQFGVETMVPAAALSKSEESVEPALATLVALLTVLTAGLLTVLVVCACLKHWVYTPASPASSKSDGAARRRILEELSTTDNPLWLESKLRPYEEQELTMTVFGDPELASEGAAQTDNTYATICGARGDGPPAPDYDTLPADDDTRAFQASTFKPPSPEVPETPPRPPARPVYS